MNSFFFLASINPGKLLHYNIIQRSKSPATRHVSHLEFCMRRRENSIKSSTKPLQELDQFSQSFTIVINTGAYFSRAQTHLF